MIASILLIGASLGVAAWMVASEVRWRLDGRRWREAHQPPHNARGDS